MSIKYEAYTWSGQKVKGVLEIDSEEAAYELLEQDQLIPYRLRPVHRRRSLAQIAPRLFQPKPQEIVNFGNYQGCYPWPLRPHRLGRPFYRAHQGLYHGLERPVNRGNELLRAAYRLLLLLHHS